MNLIIGKLLGIDTKLACPNKNPLLFKDSKSKVRSFIFSFGTIPPKGPPI